MLINRYVKHILKTRHRWQNTFETHQSNFPKPSEVDEAHQTSQTKDQQQHHKKQTKNRSESEINQKYFKNVSNKKAIQNHKND